MFIYSTQGEYLVWSARLAVSAKMEGCSENQDHTWRENVSLRLSDGYPQLPFASEHVFFFVNCWFQWESITIGNTFFFQGQANGGQGFQHLLRGLPGSFNLALALERSLHDSPIAKDKPPDKVVGTSRGFVKSKTTPVACPVGPFLCFFGQHRVRTKSRIHAEKCM